MDNIGGVPLTVNEDGGGDSPISIDYGNPNIPDEELLEVNNTIPNLDFFNLFKHSSSFQIYLMPKQSKDIKALTKQNKESE